MIFRIAVQAGLAFFTKKAHCTIHATLAFARFSVTRHVILILVAMAKTLFTRASIIERKSIMKRVAFLASFARIARLAMTYECVLSFVVRAACRIVISIYTRAWAFFTRNTSHGRPVITIFAAFTIEAFGVARAAQANACRRTILTPTMTITLLTRGRIKIAIETITARFAYLILVATTLARDCIAHVRLRA